MKILFAITFLIITNYLYSQDTIRTISSGKIIAKVIEINTSVIKYKKYSNINGPTYISSKNDIISITYLNGETEIFSNSKIHEKPINKLEDTELFEELTKKGNKIYIDSENVNVIIHATNSIGMLGYWIITKLKEEANFILKLNIRFDGIGTSYLSGQFIDPKNNNILRTTKEVYKTAAWTFNTKRGVINKFVKNEIQPMF